MPDDLALAATYPFLPEARRLVAASGVGLEELASDLAYERVRSRALGRVEEALDEGGAGGGPREDRLALEVELLSHPLARMLVAAVGEEYLLRRYAVAESKRVSAALARDPAGVVARCAAELGVGLIQEGDGFVLAFTDYLRAAPNEKDWKLIRRPVAGGRVALEADDAARLVEEAYKRSLGDELAAKRGAAPLLVRERFASDIGRLKAVVAERRKEYESTDALGFEERLIPPCMRRILADMANHVNVPHMGRFAIVTFLHRLGMDSEAILQFFSRLPDFSVEKSRYQIEHITGKTSGTEYTTPGCGTMQSFGICPLEERDGLCHAVKSPLSYYRVKWRDAPRGRGAGGPAPAAPEGGPSGAAGAAPEARAPGAPAATSEAGRKGGAA